MSYSTAGAKEGRVVAPPGLAVCGITVAIGRASEGETVAVDLVLKCMWAPIVDRRGYSTCRSFTAVASWPCVSVMTPPPAMTVFTCAEVKW